MNSLVLRSWSILGFFLFYAFIVQLYRLHVYLDSPIPVTYSQIVSIYPTNPASVWSKNISYPRQPHRIAASAVCQRRENENDDVPILVVVSSTPARYETRLAIRASWGSYFRETKSLNYGVIFAIGVNSIELEADQFHMQTETDYYNDLLVVDVLESYHNLSLKMVAAFRWIDANCPGAKVVLKTDDDTVIFGPNLMRYLNRSDGLAAPSIYCYIFRWSRATRARNSIKQFVPFEFYSGRHYPPFCSGHAYVLTRSAVHLLLQGVRKLNFYLHLEDVLLTGIVAQNVGVRLIGRTEFHSEHYDFKHPYPPEDPRWQYVYQSYFSLHYVKKVPEMMKLWNSFLVSTK